MGKIHIFIDNGHGSNTPGKHSPDRRLFEYKYTREIAQRLSRALSLVNIDARLLVPEEIDISITERVRRVNGWCERFGSQNVLLISIHNNAAGADGKWHDASGFSVFVSKNASENSKKMARLLTIAFGNADLLGNRSVPIEKYWTWSWTKNDIGILKNSLCPAVLTENFFQDNKSDVDYLLSEEGKQTIVKLHVNAIISYINKLTNG